MFQAPGEHGPRTIAFRQMLATINPYWARADAVSKFVWFSCYLTKEFDPDMVCKMLKANEHFADYYKVSKTQTKKTPEGKTVVVRRAGERVKRSNDEIVARRMELVNFMTRAGWFGHAEAELDRLVKDMPEQKGRADKVRERIERQKARDAWEHVKTLYHAGRYEAARKEADAFPLRNAPDNVLADLRDMRTRLDAQAGQMAEASKALAETAKLASSADGKLLASAVAAIKTEIHPATIGRLEAFMGQYRESYRQKARGNKPPYDADQLLSLAVSGWLLGSPSAGVRPEVSVGLWRTRGLVMDYMTGADEAARARSLADYRKTAKNKPDLDEVAQLIGHLPPFAPAKDTGDKLQEVKCGPRGNTTYHLRLPPEYTHTRSYPVLVVLHNGSEEPEEMLKRWAKPAAEHGYVLVAPRWGGRLGAGTYRYTADEQDTVIETLRDLRRRFNVDSDRVFLYGLGDGGKMAFDVGLSHPDLFAGVLPSGAGPRFFSRVYWRNAQFLPFYVVTGTRTSSDHQKPLREQFTSWISRGYPCLWVEYKGRGTEWFPAEVPMMFDWMRCQKRRFPLTHLGSDGLGGVFGDEFCTTREEDSRFYWLSTSGIARGCLQKPGRWSNFTTPAQMTARVVPQTNTVIVKTRGLTQLTVWIGRDSAGRCMVDLDRPVTMQVGLVSQPSRKIVPSLDVMLKDLHERSDRKHLFLARIDLGRRQLQ